jgi:hypothetical protein
MDREDRIELINLSKPEFVTSFINRFICRDTKNDKVKIVDSDVVLECMSLVEFVDKHGSDGDRLIVVKHLGEKVEKLLGEIAIASREIPTKSARNI